MSDTNTTTQPTQVGSGNNADWLAIQMQAPTATPADIYSMGITPNNTTMQPAEFYKDSAPVKAAFKKADGTFDDEGFNNFYTNAQKSLNAFHQDDFSLGNVTTDLWDDTSVARNLKAPINRNPVKVSLSSNDPFTNLKNAQRSFYGLTEINKWTNPKKSLAEVAEGRNVIDGSTGKDLGYTPESSGIFGFFKEPLVLSQYDEDIKDEKGNIIHHRGELKYDAEGLPRYETLAGRDPAGRQLLSKWNTVTTEGSWLNQFDVMDDDGINKSITGTIVKSVAQLLPLAIGGPVSTAYKAYYIASNLLDATAAIGKSIDGILNDDAADGNFFKYANTLQAYVGQNKTTLSDHDRENMFSLGNLANQAVDAVLMMSAQNSVFSWPSKIKAYQMAKELNLAEGTLKEAVNLSDAKLGELTSKIQDIKSYTDKYGFTGKAIEALAKNVNSLESYGKYSGYLATGYMAATMATSMGEAAKAAGLNDRDAGMLYLGYMGALVPFFKLGLSKYIEEGLSVDALAADMKEKTVEYAGKYVPAAMKENATKLAAGIGPKAKGINLIAAGRDLGKKIYQIYMNPKNVLKFAGPINGAIAGGIEMASIESLKVATQGIYNGLKSAGLTSTKGDAKFDLKGDEILKSIGSAAFGGALGGGIMHMLGHQDQESFKSKDLVGYVLNGYGDRVLKQIEDLRSKGQLGSTKLSMDPLTDMKGNKINDMWFAVDSDHSVSQNDAIADRMSKAVKVMTMIQNANDVLDPHVTAESKNQFYANIVDTATDTDLRDQIHDTANQIYELSMDLVNTPGGETTDGGAAIEETKRKLTEARAKLEYLQGDESLDEFFRQGLFNVREDINKAFGVKTIDDFAKEVNPVAKTYNNLTGDEKTLATRKFEDYKKEEGPKGRRADLIEARKEYDRFNMNMEKEGYFGRLDLYKESIKTLDDYTKAYAITYKKVTGEPISTVHEIALQDDFLDKLSAVKYIPDWIYDTIKARIQGVQSEGALDFLDKLTADPLKLRSGVITNKRSLEIAIKDKLISEFLKKKLGQKGFEEFANSIELKDIIDNGDSSSNYSLLATLKRLTNFTDNDKDLEVRNVRRILSRLDEDAAGELLYYYDDVAERGESPELMQYFDKIGLKDYINEIEQSGIDMDDLLGDGDPVDLLKAMVLVKHLDDITGGKTSLADQIALMQSSAIHDNLVLGLTVDGRYQSEGNVIHTNTIQHQDTSVLDNNIIKAREFDKQRVSSPLEEELEPINSFLKSEYFTLSQMGYENYYNSSPEFIDNMKSYDNKLNRLKALVETTISVNPLVNDFRKNNKAGLDTDLNNTELFVISAQDGSHLLAEIEYAQNRLNHLREVNEYNSNNILGKLLRIAGLDLVSKFNTLKAIATNPEVIELLPTLGNLFQIPEINDYANSYKTASDELKNKALTAMVNLESSIHADFQKLEGPARNRAINLTFKPINVDNPMFYEAADGSKEYNDFTRTIYLAKIYGSSSLDFYKRYAGPLDSESGLYSSLAKLKYAPFTNQEDAIRLSHLMMFGDRNVVEKLYNAYATAYKESGDYDFSKSTIDSLESRSMMTVWGDPGVGKSTAVLAGIMNIMDPGQGDVLLLAPKTRQVNKLTGDMIDAGFGDRIDAKNNKVVRDYLKSLGLKNRSGKAYDFDANDDLVSFVQQNENDKSVQSKFRDLFLHESKGILPNLDLFKNKSDSTYALSDNLANALGRYRIIAIDEYTHVNPVDLGILQFIVDQYNGSEVVQKDPSKRVQIVSLGDVNQMGYIGKDGGRRTYTDVTKAIVSQPLTTSLRSGWDVVNNTLVDLRNRAIFYNSLSREELGQSDTIIRSRQNPITASYYENLDGERGNLGIKVQNKRGETTVDDLKFISDNKNKITGKDVVYVVDKSEDIPKAQALLKEALGDNWTSFADIYLPEEVQGGEYKYAIIDAMPRITKDGPAKVFNLKRIHEFLNTMLSRATQATLFLNDGSISDYTTFSSQPKDKAIEQIKLSKDIIEKIKNDKQELMKTMLGEVSPETSAPSTSGQSPEQKNLISLPVARFDDFAPVFDEPSTEPRTFTGTTKSLITYNYYSTVGDYNNVFSILPGVTASDRGRQETKDRISSVINSYKYYLLHKDELGDRQISLKSNFQKLFDDNNLDWENPRFYIEAGRRGDLGMNEGRTELDKTFQATPQDFLVSLKAKIPSSSGKDLEITMGYLPSIDELATRPELKVNLGEASDVNLFERIRSFINGNGDAPEGYGVPQETKGDNRWRTEEMSLEDFENMAKIYGSRIIYDNPAQVGFHDEFKKSYFDFAISDPQVVVANLIGPSNDSVLNPNKGNNEYSQKWEKLKGKSVAFVSDVYELNALDPKEWLNTYIRQLELFNNSAFKQMSDIQKNEWIESLEDRITLPSGLEVKYRPGLVKMIKLDNPTTSFLDFRERFLAVVNAKAFGSKMTPDLLSRFNTSLYVKDRLLKSLLTLREFIKDPAGRKWFNENIVPEQAKRSQDWVEGVYQEIADMYNDGQPVDRQMYTISDLSLQKTKPLTLTEFEQALDNLLDPTAENSIYRGKYPTKIDPDTGADTNRKVYRSDIDPTINPSDLKLKLTGDKRIDFAGSLIDLRLFNLFNKTRNANFADMIDLSLTALGSFENNSDFRKYDLSKVFKKGQIEAVILAEDDRTVDRTTNVIATAIRTAGDFTFHLGKLTHPFYSIDFERLLKHMETKEQPTVEPTVQEPSLDQVAEPEVSAEPTASEQEPEQIVPAKPIVELNEPTADGRVLVDRLRQEAFDLHTQGKEPVEGDDASLVQIDPVANEANTYTATMTDGSTYELRYDKDMDNVIKTPLQIADKADPKAILSGIDKEAMSNYKIMVDNMFGDRANEPNVKVVLDYYEKFFRHTMLGSNITSMAAKFSLPEYDGSFVGYSPELATDAYMQHITDNRYALRPFTKEFRNISDYIKEYTPKVC